MELEWYQECRSCIICKRPSFLYGKRDPATGWVGWCGICNWWWRFGAAKQLTDFGCVPAILPSGVSHWCTIFVLEYLIGVQEQLAWSSGQAIVMLRIRHERAWDNYYNKLLLGEKAYYRGEDGLVREACSDEEDEDAILDAHLDYLNPMWRLQLARRSGLEPCRRPFQIVTEMLGDPFRSIVGLRQDLKVGRFPDKVHTCRNAVSAVRRW
jgi:hypothetical protein